MLSRRETRFDDSNSNASVRLLKYCIIVAVILISVISIGFVHWNSLSAPAAGRALLLRTFAVYCADDNAPIRVVVDLNDPVPALSTVVDYIVDNAKPISTASIDYPWTLAHVVLEERNDDRSRSNFLDAVSRWNCSSTGIMFSSGSSMFLVQSGQESFVWGGMMDNIIRVLPPEWDMPTYTTLYEATLGLADRYAGWMHSQGAKWRKDALSSDNKVWKETEEQTAARLRKEIEDYMRGGGEMLPLLCSMKDVWSKPQGFGVEYFAQGPPIRLQLIKINPWEVITVDVHPDNPVETLTELCDHIATLGQIDAQGSCDYPKVVACLQGALPGEELPVGLRVYKYPHDIVLPRKFAEPATKYVEFPIFLQQEGRFQWRWAWLVKDVGPAGRDYSNEPITTYSNIDFAVEAIVEHYMRLFSHYNKRRVLAEMRSCVDSEGKEKWGLPDKFDEACVQYKYELLRQIRLQRLGKLTVCVPALASSPACEQPKAPQDIGPNPVQNK